MLCQTELGFAVPQQTGLDWIGLDWAGLGCARLNQAMLRHARLGLAGPCCARLGCAVPCWTVLGSAAPGHKQLCDALCQPGQTRTAPHQAPTPCPAVPPPGIAMRGCAMPGRLCQLQAILCVPELLRWAVSSQKGCARPGLSHAVLCRPHAMLCHAMLCHDVADSAVLGCAEPGRLYQPFASPRMCYTVLCHARICHTGLH